MTLKGLVRRRINELIQGRKDNLHNGAAKDMADYSRMVGFIEGANTAYAEIEGLLGDEDDDA